MTPVTKNAQPPTPQIFFECNLLEFEPLNSSLAQKELERQ